MNDLGADVSTEISRTVSSDYDGLLLSYDMLCDQQSHMTGDEYVCEVRRHGKMAVALGDYLVVVRACGQDTACAARATEEYRETKAAMAREGCLPKETRRETTTTPIGATLPESGTPHGSALVVGGGAFATPIGVAGDVVAGFGWNSASEIGASLLSGSGTFQGVSSGFWGLRLRYSHYIQPESELKPFLRGSLVYIVTPEAPFFVNGMLADRYEAVNVGPAVEGGMLYDFTRWFGLYAEAVGGVVFGAGGHCISHGYGQVCGTTDTRPVLGGGLGIQVRLAD